MQAWHRCALRSTLTTPQHSRVVCVRFFCQPSTGDLFKLVNNKRWAEAEKALLSLRHAGTPFTPSIYIAGIKCLGGQRKFETLANLFEEVKPQANIQIWTSLIDTYGKTGKIEQVKSALAEMKTKNIAADLKLYSVLVEAYSKQGDLDGVLNVFNEAQEKNISLDTRFYNSVMDSFGKLGNVEKVEEYHQIMKSAGIKANEITYAILLDVSQQLLKFVSNLFRHMQPVEHKKKK
jgi:pentatricopeptide repeat protein